MSWARGRLQKIRGKERKETLGNDECMQYTHLHVKKEALSHIHAHFAPLLAFTKMLPKGRTSFTMGSPIKNDDFGISSPVYTNDTQSSLVVQRIDDQWSTEPELKRFEGIKQDPWG